jgi:hypothetical protein
MADLKRWFKVWTSILDDPDHANLSLEATGQWTRLGALTALAGEGGKLRITPPGKRLLQVLEVHTLDMARTAIEHLPNITIEEGKGVNGEFTVTWKNWKKYQVDSTVAERMKALRSKRRGEEKRGEEKRGEEKKEHIHARNGHDLFDAFWSVYPRREAKARALKAWNALNPNPGLAAALQAAVEQHKRRLWAQAPADKIPHAATWLNGRRWEDELPAMPANAYQDYPRL